MAEVIDFPGTPSDQAEPETVAVVPEHAEAIKGDHQRHPIVPEQWQRHNIRSTVSYLAGLHWHRTRFHGLRSPAYLAGCVFYALRGGARLTGRLARWAHWVDGWKLESMAVAAGRAGHLDAIRAHEKVGSTILGASAMLHMNATGPQTAEKAGCAILHVAATNRPALVDLSPYEAVVAASAEAWPYGVITGDVLMLCEPSPESLVMLAPDTEPDYPQPDSRRPAVAEYASQYDMQAYEIARLGMTAQQLSRRNSEQGAVTSAAARMNEQYISAGHGRRPDYGDSHPYIVGDTALSAEDDDIGMENVTSYALKLSGRTGGRASFGDLMDAACELAFERDWESANEPASIAQALLDLADRLPGEDSPDCLAVAAEAEVDRLELAREPAAVGDIVARNPDLFARGA